MNGYPNSRISQPGVCSLLLDRENRAFFRIFGCHLMKLFLLSDVVEILELLALSVLSRSVTFMVLTECACRRVFALPPSFFGVLAKLCVILRRKRSFFFGLCSGRGEPVSPETETMVVSASGTLKLGMSVTSLSLICIRMLGVVTRWGVDSSTGEGLWGEIFSITYDTKVFRKESYCLVLIIP